MPAKTARMGREEIEIIAPAIAELQAEGIDGERSASRPTRCSTPRRAHDYDVAICMYHDQALIPIKTLAFDSAVNVTLGLPFVRTSPDHGTAFDIAGKGQGRSGEPDRGAAAGRAARRARWPAASQCRVSGSTICRRCATSSPRTVSTPGSRSARTFFSTSI